MSPLVQLRSTWVAFGTQAKFVIAGTVEPFGTSTLIVAAFGVPGLKTPRVALPEVGGTSASKRKLYIVLQRMAFASEFVENGVVAQLTPRPGV